MWQIPGVSEGKPHGRKGAPEPASAVESGNACGNWADYTLGPAESLKNINDILTQSGKAATFEFINEIFERIAADLRDHGQAYCRQEYRRQMAELLGKVAAQKHLGYLMLLTLYHRMYVEWEGSLRHEPIHVLLDAVTAYYQATLPSRTPPEQYVVTLFLGLFRILSCGMRTENALNINCPLGMLKHSAEVEAIVTPEPSILRFDDNEKMVIGWAAREIADSRAYFAALAEISKAVIGWLGNRADWRAITEKVEGSVVVARDSIKAKSYFYATELNAQRTTLQHILEFGEASQTEAEFFTVIYCFPFVIREFRPTTEDELAAQAKRIFERWRAWSDSRPATDLFGRAFKPTSFEQVELADVWAIASEVPQIRRRKLATETATRGLPDLVKPQKCYNLQAINLPDIIIHDVEDLDKQIVLRAEVRLSLFGNHYLRFSASRGEEDDFRGYAQVNGHDIHRTLRRASSLSGKEPISSEDGNYRNFPADPDGAYRPDGNLMDVAKRLVQSLGEALTEGMSIEHDLAKTSNVIFSLTEFSNGATTAGAGKHVSALRRLFMNPIGGPADRLEPWLSRAIDAKGRNLAKPELGDQAEIYTTANTTLIRLPSHAHFVRLDYEEMAEFVATLEPLYNHWNTQISSRMEEVIDDLRRRDVAKIESSRVGLQQVVVSAQKAMLDIESPGIVTNSVYRSYLDAFIKQSTVGTLKKNFQELTRTTQDVVNTVSDYAQKQEDKWLQTQRYIVGIVVGAAALAVSLGQLTEFKLICVGNNAPQGACVIRIDEREAKAGGNPNSVAGRSQPSQTDR